MLFTRVVARLPRARRARPPQSSIARASRARKKGNLHRSARLRCGKKIKGKKRHVLVDTQGLLMHAIVHAADLQDRDAGVLLMASLFGAFPFLVRLYADGGYQGPQFQSAMKRVLRASTSRSSNDRIKPKASSPCPSAGSSNAPSPGSAAAVDWRRIGMSQSQGARLPASRLHSPHAPKAMQSRLMFSDNSKGIRCARRSCRRAQDGASHRRGDRDADPRQSESRRARVGCPARANSSSPARLSSSPTDCARGRSRCCASFMARTGSLTRL